ncbi:putative gustatory receptor 57a [Ceratitis capitata]|nr:putative gustatory receptor 57a [Ceratitis capitata]
MSWRRLFYQPESTYEANGLFTAIQFITCCNGFIYRRGHFIVNFWTKLYTMLMPFITILSLGLGIQQLINDPVESARFEETDQLWLAVCVLEMIMATVAYVLIVYSMVKHTRDHVELYDRISALDRLLLRDFGVNLKYHKLMRKNLIEYVILSIVYCVALCWTLFMVKPNKMAHACGMAYAYLAMTAGPHCSSYLQVNFAAMLRIRFRLLQKLLDEKFLLAKFPQSGLREVRLLKLVDVVRAFHELIDAINDVYRVTLTVGLAHDFTLVTIILYMLFGHSMGEAVDGVFFAFGGMWLAVPLHKFLTAPVYCNRAIEEGKRCLRLIEKIDICFPNFKSAKRIVTATMHWRLENKIQFTCGFNMIYNKTIITTITAVVFNYLLILIQFRMTQLMGKQIEEQKNILQDWIGDL